MDCLYLVRNGVPFDVAFSLPADERLAWVVALHVAAALKHQFLDKDGLLNRMWLSRA